VVENFPPLSNGQDHSSDELAIGDLVGGITSNYPLTLVVGTGDALELVLILERQQFSADVASATLRALCDVIESIVCGHDLVVSEATAKANLSPLRRADGGSPSNPTARPAIVATYVAPRDATELKLAEIWQRMLDIRDVGIRDDFFDLGGQSILATRLVAEIEQAFGTRLPVATLFERSTIEKLATVLRDESWSPSWSSIVPMQTQGDGVPVFCLHSWTGDVLMYRGIARNLAPDHPVYGLQAAGLDGSAQPIDDMVEMARAYVDDIRNVSPTGPVALVGRCFSGPLALEMARQFSASGVEVAAVVNLDSGRPEKLPPRIRARWRGNVPSPRRARTPGYYLKRLRHLHKENGTVGLLQNQILLRLRRVQREPDVIETVDDVPLDMQTERVVEAAARAWLEHDLEKYRGTLTLIRSAESAARRSADWQVADWAKWVDLLVTVTVPGEHGTMLLEPHVAAVAAEIKESIGRLG
jgi:thioesterase domain-containing protein/acyl carrier protein